MLVNRLKQLMEQKHRVVEQEHEITDEQIEIQAILEAKARERERDRAMSMEQSSSEYSAGEPEAEALPVPAAMIHDQQHPGKRHGVNAVSCKYSPPPCPSSLQRGDESSPERKFRKISLEHRNVPEIIQPRVKEDKV